MKMRESFLQRVGAFAGIVMAIAALCASAVLVAGAAAPRAAFADDTTYMVRVFAGNQGTVDGGNVWTTTVKAGESLQFDAGLIAVTDDRYYARGIREAGLDNSQVFAGNTSIPIVQDIDFVVAYGIRSSAVRYTVKFQAADGSELAADKTFFGNVGDKPVVAFAYVEGYLPQAYNLTKTLVADESQNVFIFTYRPMATSTAVTPAVPGEDGNQGGGNQSGTDGQGGNGGQGGDNQGGNGGNGGGQDDEPQQIIDLDTPTTDGDDQGGAKRSFPWAVVAGVVGGGAAIGLGWAFFKRRKR